MTPSRGAFRDVFVRCDAPSFARTTLFAALAILLLVPLANALAGALAALWLRLFPAHPLPPVPPVPDWPAYPLPVRIRFLLSALLLAPVCEELLFRGLLQTLLLRRLSPRVAYPVVALAFAIPHGLTPAILPLVVLSLILSPAARAAGLLSPILLHSAYNLLVLLSVLLVLFH